MQKQSAEFIKETRYLRVAPRWRVAGLPALLIGFLLLTGSCSLFEPAELQIEEVIFCDLIEADRCSDPWGGATRIYRPAIPDFKTNSWFDLAYHMYFHTRETPGMLVRFNRTLQPAEKQLLRKSAQCEMQLSRGTKSITVHMEGSKRGDDYIWCFD